MPAPVNSNESHCTFTLASDVTAGGLPSEEEISKDLESTDPKVKRHALKAAIMAMLGGEPMPRILMQVIRFCINSDDKPLKKLCMLYWEVVPKYQEPTSEEKLAAQQAGGQAPARKLLPEMILVCNALMNDLNHPNEYVRGSMLRFLCKVNDEEILGPLVPSIKACLEHRHPYVRKNAALSIFHAHKLHGETLIPDGPELIAAMLAQETDVAARRNAFLMLFNENEGKSKVHDDVTWVRRSEFGGRNTAGLLLSALCFVLEECCDWHITTFLLSVVTGMDHRRGIGQSLVLLCPRSVSGVGCCWMSGSRSAHWFGCAAQDRSLLHLFV